MKILIVLPDLRLGGAEKNMINLANALQKSGHSVIILLVLGTESIVYTDISEGIEIVRFNFSRFRSILFRPFKLIKLINTKAINVLFVGYGELNPLIAIFSLIFWKVRFIARETSIPSLHINKSIIRKLYHTTYNLFDRIIVQSESMKLDLLFNFGITPNRIVLIPNLLDTDKIDLSVNIIDKKLNLPPRKFILFVGTINENKRVDKIVDFHSRLLSEGYDFDLVIIGDGPQFESLRDHVKSKVEKERIHLLGSLLNPYVYMRHASFLIIASDYEGFPNVGIEAQYCGVPVILSDTTLGGAKELVINGFNGEIINLENGNLAFLHQRYDNIKISTHVKSKHGLRHVFNLYQDLF